MDKNSTPTPGYVVSLPSWADEAFEWEVADGWVGDEPAGSLVRSVSRSWRTQDGQRAASIECFQIARPAGDVVLGRPRLDVELSAGRWTPVALRDAARQMLEAADEYDRIRAAALT